MNLRSTAGLLASLIVLIFVGAGSAQASNISAIIRDCEHQSDGRLHGHYSLQDLRKARQNLPADVDEYSDCREVIGRAMNALLGNRGHGQSGPTGFAPSNGSLPVAPTQREADAVRRATSGPKKPLHVHGKTISPGAIGLERLASRHKLPATVIVPLSLLGLLGLTTTGWPLLGKYVFLRWPR